MSKDKDAPLDLEAIEAREKAATEGPWKWVRCYQMRSRHWALVNPHRRDGGVGDGQNRVVSVPLVLLSDAREWFGKPFEEDSDLQFVSHARTDIPALTREVRRLLAENTSLTVEVERLKEPSEGSWQPIDCAPKDGHILVARLSANQIVWWYKAKFKRGSEWSTGNGMVVPTHWMKLPDPPKVEAEGEGG